MDRASILRKVDALGRIVLPIGMRSIMNWDIGDSIEIFVKNGGIYLKKFDSSNIVSGMVRNLDTLGRIVIPMEIRRTFDIRSNDGIEILLNSGQIILKKCQNRCIFCNSIGDLVNFKNKAICKDCVKSISKL